MDLMIIFRLLFSSSFLDPSQVGDSIIILYIDHLLRNLIYECQEPINLYKANTIIFM